MTLLLASLLLVPPSHAVTTAPSLGCAFQISASPAHIVRSFSNYVSLPNGHELFVRIEKPLGREPIRWFLALHGLLETHRSYDQVAERLVSRGYGVVRVDLHGFGRSLLREIQTLEMRGRVFYPQSKIPVDDQVNDMVLLLEHLRDHEGIDQPDLIGHSMGGALVLALAGDSRGAALTGDRVTGVAPYIYRVDFDIIEYMMYLGFNPLVRLNTVSQFIPHAFKAGPAFWADSMSEQGLRTVLNRYFDDKILAREFDVAPEHRASIRRQFVTSAIGAKRGLEEFSAYPALEKLPPNKRYDLVYGEFDPLIRKGAALQFGERVLAHGGRVLGLDTDHDVLERQPGSLVEHLATP